MNHWACPVQERCVRRTPDTPFVDDLYRPEIPNRRNSRLVAADQGELLPQLALEGNAGTAKSGVARPNCCK